MSSGDGTAFCLSTPKYGPFSELGFQSMESASSRHDGAFRIFPRIQEKSPQ
jgi:hypothetical protein